MNGTGKSAREIWETAKGTLQVQVNKANFDTWLKDTVGISLREDQFIVGTPKAFAKEWLERRLSSLVEKTLIGIVGHEVEVTFQVCASPDPIPDNPRPPRQSQRPYQSRLPLPKLNPRYTFETFVVGDSNRLAYAAAVGVAEEPGKQHNPLFIFGDSGLGKTHLAHAIGNEACRDGLVVAYASGEQFTNEFVDAIRDRTVDQFRHKFRSPDIFILEDIQFVMGKQQTQMSLFHTFDELYNANRQVVITGDRPPASMASMDKGLSS
ncbi:MAG: DnaA/Hda family protein, partial [Chloroflexi bacterium]|nr:DnaA/Hda family protein [Chloroflexota bacterium]